MSTLVETMERIRTERQRLRSFPDFLENNNDNYKDSGCHGDNYKDSGCNEDNYKDSGCNEDNKVDNKVDDIHDSNVDNVDIGELKEIDDIEKLLTELKNNEPSSDNQFFRLSIIAYEMGDLHRSIVYAERFKNDPKIRVGHLANGKLALADALTQLYLLCVSLDWNFQELRRLGAQHLTERHKDFKRDGWSEIK